MDTEKLFLTNEKLDIVYRELEENDLNTVRYFVEITRHLQEIHHFLLIFIKNIDCMQKEYVLMNTGNVIYNQKPAIREEDYIAINSYIINIISAGRTLVESMECYVESNMNTDAAAKQKYLDFYHKTYDSSFAYRLLIRLRDYSQHGHLPVSSTGNNYYFDLVQIVDKPHYNHNKTLETEMKNIVHEIITVYRDTPTIALTETLAEFVEKLLSIYKMFWYQTEHEFAEAYANFQNIISAYPENIINEEDGRSDFFVYDMVDCNAHIVNIKSNAQEMLNMFKKESECLYNEYAEAFKELLSGNILISCSQQNIDMECY